MGESEKKKKGKKGRKKSEPVKSVLDSDVHWTEEERNQWGSEKKEVSKVTNLLKAMNADTGNDVSDFIAESLKDTISNCKRLELQSEEEKQQRISETNKVHENLKKEKKESQIAEEKRIAKDQ